jgi:cyclopropane-fatty-acyl-phospholipid synthase
MPSLADRVVQLLQDRHAAIPGDHSPTIGLRIGDKPIRIFGKGEPKAVIVAQEPSGISALISMDLNRIAEAYVLGDLEVDGDLMEVLPLRTTLNDRHPLAFLMRFARPLLQGQVTADHRMVPQHYERDAEFFLSFLDSRHRCYSHGVFASEDESLEDAMTRKLEYALDAIQVREGDHILDIGGGWGTMTEFAGMRGVRVTSLTISEVSRSFIQQLIDRERLPCEVRLEHFFEHSPAQRYDAIVNLGVTEHLPDYARTLRHYDALLAPGGRVYLDASAGRTRWQFSSFFERYIYRGNSSLLCLHEYLQVVTASAFEAEAVHNDRLSYGLTARHWAENLDRRQDEVVARWGPEAYRLFKLYLWGCTDAFARDLCQAYRVVLARPTHALTDVQLDPSLRRIRSQPANVQSNDPGSGNVVATKGLS